MDEDERDPFAGLGWEVEKVRLADPHTFFLIRRRNME